MPKQRHPLNTPSTYKPTTTLNNGTSKNNPRNNKLAYANNNYKKTHSRNHTEGSRNKNVDNSGNIVAVMKNILISIPELFITLYKKSKKLGILATVIAIVFVLIIFDSIFNSSKIYNGISIGDVDVSGLTTEQAKSKLEDYYSTRINNKTIYIFTDKDSYESINIDDYFQKRDMLAEQISAEEDAHNTRIVATSPTELGANINSEMLSKQAFEVGKHFNYLERLGTRLFGKNISTTLDFGDGFDVLINSFNDFLGQSHVDYNVEFNGSEFVVTDGHDGTAINPRKLSIMLESDILNDSSEISKVLIEPEYDPIIINEASANLVCDKLNRFCENDTTLTYNSNYETIDGKTLASWIKTSINNNELVPEFDYQSFLKDIKSKFDTNASIDGIEIKNDNGDLSVHLEQDVSVPDYYSAINSLNEALKKESSIDLNIEIKPSNKTNDFTFDEAINFGIVRKLSYFTTTYTSTRSTINRNHNIHLISDILNNTIISPNDEFSFLSVAGDMSEEDGFLEAGAMSNGEVVQSVAGGVCQVATTVFNAAYDAGLDITERHNHQMQISSYPTGLDAAINVADQDLRFINDTTSDVLLRAEYNETSVTVSLYGACERRNIETEVSDSKTEKKFTTKFEETNKLNKDKWAIKTKGVDGTSITATRTVTGQNKHVLHYDAFYSYYIPTNQVVLVGEGSDISLIQKEIEGDSKND